VSPVLRKSIRILLLNDKNELLLMCVEDFDISSPGGTRNKRFWCTIGGGIESGESLQQAALRELYEETGIETKDIELGPLVWYGEVDLMIKGTLTRLQESFIVAKTKLHHVSLHQPTPDEKQVVKKLEWFSLDLIRTSPDVIFPVVLPDYLSAILVGDYPKQPLEIDLKKHSKL
jgi:8-oxo-dGTP pyrophosphatase MutT (NUDIX family)